MAVSSFICVDVDPNAPHDEECGFWHGFSCTCKPEMRRALEVKHDEECDFLHGSGYNRCSCGAATKAESEEDQDCYTCGGSSDAVQDRCRKSKRDCAHHCNHIWTHDICHWCGLEIGDEGELIELDDAA